MEAGSRVFAVRSSDGETTYLFGYGVYEGREVPPGFPFPNPKITLDNGKGVVWGYQCWWGSEELFAKKFGHTTVVEVPIPNDTSPIH